MTALKTAPSRSLRYEADLGTLVIRTARGADCYGVFPLPGRVVRLVKFADLTTRYTVTTDPAGRCSCDCPAGRYRRECKHADAVSVLVERGLVSVEGTA